MSKNAGRVFCVCIDGLGRDYLDSAIASGATPVIAELRRRGASLALDAVYPHMTAATWPSIFTGVSPDRHSIHGWWKFNDDGRDLTAVSGHDVPYRSVWDYVGVGGKRVVVLNVPLTYPAYPVMGSLVAGFDSPFQNAELSEVRCYPRDLLQSIKKRGLDYPLMRTYSPFRTPTLEEHLDEWIEDERRRVACAIALSRDQNPDLFMIALHSAAYFHHLCHKNSPLLRKLYTALDSFVAQILELGDSEDTRFVFSDHGAIEIRRHVYIHNWLEREGFLRFHPYPSEASIVSVAEDDLERTNILLKDGELDLFKDKLRAELRCGGLSKRREYFRKHRDIYPGMNKSFDNIDWTRTTVYSYSNYGQLRVNVAGREPCGIVRSELEYESVRREVAERLRGLVDEGKLVFQEVRLPTGGYPSTRSFSQIPDITAIVADDSYYMSSIYRYHWFSNDVFCDVDVAASRVGRAQPASRFLPRVGDHCRGGFMIASGPNIESRDDVHGSILDIAPTVLRCLGCAIPRHFEGQVLPIFCAPNGARAAHRASPSAELSERLKSWGYRI